MKQAQRIKQATHTGRSAGRLLPTVKSISSWRSWNSLARRCTYISCNSRLHVVRHTIHKHNTSHNGGLVTHLSMGSSSSKNAPYGGNVGMPQYSQLFSHLPDVSAMLQDPGRSLDYSLVSQGWATSGMMYVDTDTVEPLYFTKTHAWTGPDFELYAQGSGPKPIGIADLGRKVISMALGAGGMSDNPDHCGFLKRDRTWCSSKQFHLMFPSQTAPNGKMDIMLVNVESTADMASGVFSRGPSWRSFLIMDQQRGLVLGICFLCRGAPKRRGMLHLKLNMGGQPVLYQRDVEWILLAMAALARARQRESARRQQQQHQQQQRMMNHR